MNRLVFLAGNAIRLTHAPHIRQKARDSSRGGQVEQRGKTVLFMTSSAGQLHL